MNKNQPLISIFLSRMRVTVHTNVHPAAVHIIGILRICMLRLLELIVLCSLVKTDNDLRMAIFKNVCSSEKARFLASPFLRLRFAARVTHYFCGLQTITSSIYLYIYINNLSFCLSVRLTVCTFKPTFN